MSWVQVVTSGGRGFSIRRTQDLPRLLAFGVAPRPAARGPRPSTPRQARQPTPSVATLPAHTNVVFDDGVVVFRPDPPSSPTSVRLASADTPPPPPRIAAWSRGPPQPVVAAAEAVSATRIAVPAADAPAGAPDPAFACPAAAVAPPQPAPAVSAAPAACLAAAGSNPSGTTYQQPPSCTLRVYDEPARHRGTRRPGASHAAVVPSVIPSAAPLAVPAGKGKGARHARKCGGPFVAALDRMPPEPPTGARRAAAGLANVRITSKERRGIRQERAARALVALLPRGSASFILDTPAAVLESRPDAAVAEDLVSVLSDQGVGSLDAAASALGRVMTYVMEHHSADTAINGLHIKYFLEANPASQRFVDGVRWLRDWCGVDLPARGGIMRSAARTSAAPRKSLDTLEMDLKIACHLEYVGVYHPSPFVRGHAGGWSFMGRSMMRFEQSTSSCINSLVAHSAFGLDVTVASVSLCRDKHPDPAKQRPRPAWAALDGLADQQAILAPLREMLAGREELQCILVDTDSPDGDPSHPATTQWLLDPLSSHRRADHSLHGLLRLAPLKMSAEQAARYHGHFAKRYLANVSKTSPDFSSAHRRDLGRFAGSSAQSSALEPVAAMLVSHDLAATVLPDIYARNAIVSQHLDLAVRAYAVLRHAYSRAVADVALFNRCWSTDDGPFSAPVPALAGSIPRLELELAAPAPAPALMPPAAAAAPIIVDVTPTEGGGPAVGP